MLILLPDCQKMIMAIMLSTVQNNYLSNYFDLKYIK